MNDFGKALYTAASLVGHFDARLRAIVVLLLGSAGVPCMIAAGSRGMSTQPFNESVVRGVVNFRFSAVYPIAQHPVGGFRLRKC